MKVNIGEVKKKLYRNIIIVLNGAEVNLKDLDGLNMINGSNIWVHYVDSMNDLVKEYTKLLKTKIICIPEDRGLYIRNMNEDGEEMGEVRVVDLEYSQ